MLDQAERLSSWGFALHWLRPRSKAPVNDSWSTERVASLATLKKTYREGYNLGVRLGEPSFLHDLYLHCIDLDIRDADKTDEAWAALLELIPEARSLPSVISGSLGESRHLYFLTERPFPSKKLRHSSEKIIGKDKKSHWAWEIERFGTGKQVVVPPSIHPDTGKRYKWEREWPADLVELGVGPVIPAARVASWEPPSRDETDVRTNPLGLSVADAKDILADLPTDTWREDRDGWLQVGMALHHEFGGSKEGFRIWVEFSAASDKYDPEDQRRVWRSFRQSSKPVRMATLLSAAKEVRLMNAFDDLGDDDGEDDPEVETATADEDVDDLLGADDTVGEQPERVRKLKQAEVHHELGHVPKWVARINKEHACAFVEGKTVILTERGDNSVTYGTVHDLHNFYENDRRPTEKSTEAITKAWMRHKGRRSYRGIVFAPNGAPADVYNHWRGFAVESNPTTSCDLFLGHLRENICDHDDVAYDWLIKWLAHLVQRPEEKPGTAVVLKGIKGTGKDTVGDVLQSFFPRHYHPIAQSEQLTGRFNMHLEKLLLLHVQEAFWAGNRSAEGALKYIITSEKVMIEPKGLNAFSVDSYLRIFISANADWVVPATFDERRFFVLEVSRRRAKDTTYFRKVRRQMFKEGGVGALMHFLRSIDINDFDVRNPPVTKALIEQKIEGLRGINKWTRQLLTRGQINSGDSFDDLEADWSGGPVRVACEDLYAEFTEWVRRTPHQGDTPDNAKFGKELRELIGVKHTRRRVGGSPRYFYEIPSLGECKRLFEAKLGGESQWGDDVDVDETEDDLLGD